MSPKAAKKPREPSDGRCCAMKHPASTGAGLVRMGDPDFVPQNPEDDLRGKDVYDPEGQRIGGVKDLYIDHREREMRFLQVSAGGFLGMGEKPLLVPVEAIVEVAENRLTIEPGRMCKVEGPAPFGTRVTPSDAGAFRHEDRASLTYDAPEGRADRRLEEARSSLPYGCWPH
jgi:sporulation protein YlmC with PRC-barrel domain